jgi:predicted nucleic acid-binding protein
MIVRRSVDLFVDSSVWFAAVYAKDRNNSRAKSILQQGELLFTTDHIIVETWLLLRARFHRRAAESFWERIRLGAVTLEYVTAADMETAWTIGRQFADQDFSLPDRTSFAVMERLGLTRVASFDDDFAVYRYGRAREKAFTVVR